MLNKHFIVNPAIPGGTKPVELISDRAKRYRANQDGVRPPDPRLCAFCGSGRNVDSHHKDGDESNGRSDNLCWACRSCNSAIAVAFKRAGLGVATDQFNPRGVRGATAKVPSFAEYSEAAASHRRGAHDAGGAVIHKTPKRTRELYSKLAWDRRRERGTDRKSGDTPF